MTKNEKKRFVKDLSATIAKDICEQIKSGKIPDNWDGHELRFLLAYRYEESAKMSRLMTGRRLKEFKNTCLVNGL